MKLRALLFLSCLLTLRYAQSQSLVRYYNQSLVGFSTQLGEVEYTVNYKYAGFKKNSWSIDVYSINGIQIRSQQLGVGVGGDIWNDRWFIPIFLNYSSTFLVEKKVAPHAGFDLGYAFGRHQYPYVSKKDDVGSVFVRPNVGILVKITPRMHFVAHAFYKMQSIRAESEYITYNMGNPLDYKKGYYKYWVYYHFMGVNVGIKI